MGSQSVLKTVLWIDPSPVRRALVLELFRAEGLELFAFSDLEELSGSVLGGLAPTLIVLHSDLLTDFQSEFESYSDKVVVLDREARGDKSLVLPIKPLELIQELADLAVENN